MEEEILALVEIQRTLSDQQRIIEIRTIVLIILLVSNSLIKDQHLTVARDT